jgi:GAF domain-containing protein
MEGRAVSITDVLHDPEYTLSEGQAIAGYRSILGVPLFRENTLIGVFSIARTRVDPFTNKEIELGSTFADQAVIAIENARLFNETKEALERQTATGDVLNVISRSPTDAAPVFQVIGERAEKLCNAEISVVSILDSDLIRVAGIRGMSRVGVELFRTNFPMPLHRQTVTARTIKSGTVVHVSDVLFDPSYDNKELAAQTGYRNCLGVPLHDNGRVIGAIFVARTQPGLFSDNQVRLLQIFADQAVIAIQNVKLFEEVQARTHDLEESLQQQTATADVLKVISRSTFDLPTVLQTLVESAARLCDADKASITRQKDGIFFRAETYGLSNEFLNFIRTVPVVPDRGSAGGRTLLEGIVIHISDVQADPEYTFTEAQRLGDFRTILNVPMLREGVPIGLIALMRSEVRPFNDKQIALATTFADQAAIAIENVRLFDEVQAKTRDLSEALTYQTGSSNILSVIASSPTDVEPVLKAIVESACEICDANDAAVLLKDGEELRPGAHHGPIPVLLEKWPIDRSSVTGRSVIDRVPVHIHDVLSQEGAELPLGQQMSRRDGFRSILSVPMLREGESIGAIALRRAEVHPFSDKQIALLQTFADQAVIAIENARLFNETREALEQQTATSEVLKVISSTPGDLEPVFKSMLENATRICGANFGQMNLYEKGRFRPVANYNVPAAYTDWLTKQPPFQPHPQSGLGTVVRMKQVVHIGDVRALPAYLVGDSSVLALSNLARARSYFVVPMLKENELIGAITIYRQEVKPFAAKQTEVVANFASQAVIAIENARLLNELRERTTELSCSLEELRTAQDRLVQTEKLASLGQLTAGIAHEIKNPLNFVNNFSALSAELVDEMTDVFQNTALDEASRRKELDEIRDLLKSNLEKVVQHGKRADSIVKNMLLHSREGSGELRAADINGLVEESLNLAYHGARAEKTGFNITLKREFDASAGSAELFPQEITRALLNLISNGFYAATKRKAEKGEAGFEPTLSAATKNLGASIEIRIRDNGVGIPPEVKEKIFNPFFTTKPAGEGTGLGLSMTHDIIVKQHGGTIRVDTEPGAYTEFVLTLPRATGAQNDHRSTR